MAGKFGLLLLLLVRFSKYILGLLVSVLDTTSTLIFQINFYSVTFYVIYIFVVQILPFK